MTQRDRTLAIRRLCLWRTSGGALVLTLLAACGGGVEAPASRPNIVFVFSDDHAPHALSAYGSVLTETPQLDRLAREGMLFRNAFVSNSICAPSRAVLLTGKHSHINGQLTNLQVFDGGQQTFPKLLQAAGYQTAWIGKWHLESLPTGFDHWQILPGQGDYYRPEFITPSGSVEIEGYVTDIITDLSLDWLRSSRDPDRPFMLVYSHKAPHRNWMPGPDHLPYRPGHTFPEPPSLLDDGAGRTSAVQVQEMTLEKHFRPGWDLKFPPSATPDETIWRQAYERMDEAQREAWDRVFDARWEEYQQLNPQGPDRVRWIYQQYIRDYLSTIASLDDNFGRFLEYLEEAGLASNTVVIYSSDQGFFLGDRGWYDKRWMYEESLRMPLMVRWPGAIKPGTVSGDLVQNIDFAPTLLEIAGVEIPEDIQGVSLVPILRGNSPPEWRESIYYHYYEYPAEHSVHRHYGVRTQRHKLIHYYQLGEWELFDLENDPGETRNLYADPDHAAVVEELKQELERLRRQYKVPETDPL